MKLTTREQELMDVCVGLSLDGQQFSVDSVVQRLGIDPDNKGKRYSLMARMRTIALKTRDSPLSLVKTNLSGRGRRATYRITAGPVRG